MKSDSWNPQQYEKFKSERSQPFLDLLDYIQDENFKHAIDLGCGTGELTRIMHERFIPIDSVGMDSSDAMLAKSSAHAGNGLRFEKGNIDTWVAPEKYDLILSNAALQWNGNHPDLFARLFKSLAPGGQLAVQMPMNHDYPTHTLAHQMSTESEWKTKLGGETYEKVNTMLTPEAYASLLFSLGFREQKVTMNVYGHILESRAGVIEWVRGSLLTYFQSRLSPEDFQKFTAEFQERLFKILPDQKPYFYTFKRIFIWGRK